METHRVVHDFGDLTYEDIEAKAPFNFSPSHRPYPLLLGALVLGVLFGFLVHRE